MSQIDPKELDRLRKEIGGKVRQLDRDREVYRARVMKEYDAQHYAARKALIAQCGSISHNFKFSHIGPTGKPWYFCSICNLSQSKDE